MPKQNRSLIVLHMRLGALELSILFLTYPVYITDTAIAHLTRGALCLLIPLDDGYRDSNPSSLKLAGLLGYFLLIRPRVRALNSKTIEKTDHKDRFFLWCGYRDSNPGPHPWQGCALTAELHPHT
jgi:hypothetical protein